MDYLHYYFSNYINENPEDLSYISRGKRVELIQRQMQLLAAHRKTYLQNSETVNEFGQALDMLTGKESREQMRQIYEGAAHQMPQINGINISSIANMSVANIEKRLNLESGDIIDTVIDFYNSLTSVLDNIFSIVNSDGAFGAFQEQVLLRYCQDNEVPESDAASTILQEVMSSEGLKSVKGGSDIDTYLQRLTLLAYSLASYEGQSMSYGTTRGKGGVIESAPEFFKVISQKTTGLLNNIIGRMGELAAARAQEVGLSKLDQAFADLQTYVDKSFGQVESRGNTWLEHSVSQTGELIVPEKPSVIQTNTADVQVTLTDTKASISYGINVKDYKLDKKAKYQRIRIGTNLSFLEAYNKVYGKNDLVYSLGASHEGVSNPDAPIYSETMITQLWQDLIATTVAGSVLDTLAGLPTENTLFLSINGQLFTIEEVLEKIQRSVLGEDSAMLATGTLLSDLKRENMLSINEWKTPSWRSKKAGWERSDEVLPTIVSNLNAARLNINLKMLSTLLR